MDQVEILNNLLPYLTEEERNAIQIDTRTASIVNKIEANDSYYYRLVVKMLGFEPSLTGKITTWKQLYELFPKGIVNIYTAAKHGLYDIVESLIPPEKPENEDDDEEQDYTRDDILLKLLRIALMKDDVVLFRTVVISDETNAKVTEILTNDAANIFCDVLKEITFKTGMLYSKDAVKCFQVPYDSKETYRKKHKLLKSASKHATKAGENTNKSTREVNKFVLSEGKIFDFVLREQERKLTLKEIERYTPELKARLLESLKNGKFFDGELEMTRDFVIPNNVDLGILIESLDDDTIQSISQQSKKYYENLLLLSPQNEEWLIETFQTKVRYFDTDLLLSLGYIRIIEKIFRLEVGKFYLDERLTNAYSYTNAYANIDLDEKLGYYVPVYPSKDDSPEVLGRMLVVMDDKMRNAILRKYLKSVILPEDFYVRLLANPELRNVVDVNTILAEC